MKWRLKKNIMIVVVIFIILILLDYMNISTLCGMEMSNINWDLWVSIVNVTVVIGLYLFTYKMLDERAVQRENNKTEISMLLINSCYRECMKYMQLLDQETVEKYIVPKINFNSSDNILMSNLQSASFKNHGKM